MKKLQSLEMIRAAAAILVVLFHTEYIFGTRAGHVTFGDAFYAGKRGVDLFFVLSGFIITYVHSDDIGRPGRLKYYLFKRFSRIYPLVWIMSAVAFLSYFLGFGGADKIDKLNLSSLIASVMLLPQKGDALVAVTWTLKYEIFFYCVFAVLIFNRAIGITTLLAWQAITLIVFLYGGDLGLAGFYFQPICLEFSIGMLCAYWVCTSQTPASPAPWFGVLGFGIACFVAGMKLDGIWSVASVSCAIGAGAIVVSVVNLERAGRVRIPAFIVSLGEASYAIYLVHFSVITILAVVLVHKGVRIGDLVCLACACCGILAGLILDRFGDRPIQRFLQRWWRSRRAKAREAPSAPPVYEREQMQGL